MWEWDFPGGSSGEEPTCQCKRCGFDPYVGKILWRREWLHTLVFCPGEFHQEKPVRLLPIGSQSWTWLKWLSTHDLRIPQCLFFSSVQSLSHLWLFATPWTAASQASLSITNTRSLPKLMSIEPVMPSNQFILCRPLLLPSSIFPSIRVFSNESILPIRWPKYWSFSFGISPSNEYSGLLSFRMDWLDLLAVQGTLRSPLQHHSSQASILQHSAFFVVQLSHPYMTTGKNTAFD